jgi:hypothetical protein
MSRARTAFRSCGLPPLWRTCTRLLVTRRVSGRSGEEVNSCSTPAGGCVVDSHRSPPSMIFLSALPGLFSWGPPVVA